MLPKNIYRKFFVLFLLVSISTHVIGQDDSTYQRSGNIYGDLFLNANYNMNKSYASVRLNRLHFGYKYNLSESFYFNGMIESALEAYGPIADSLGDDYNGITNLFEFCVGFSFSNLEGKFGLIGTEFNQQQEKLWQHRYIDKVFADKYGFAPTNDFGLMIIYKPIDLIKFDIAITNGEGHKSLQSDSVFRVALGGTLNIFDRFIARVYSDYLNYSTAGQTNLIGILGYTSDMINGGLEWNQQFNSSGVEDLQRSGFSGYVSANINEKYQLFGRYDVVSSNKPSGAAQAWNILNDGDLIIIGLEYKIINGLTVALDYRYWNPADSTDDSESYVFFDVEIKF